MQSISVEYTPCKETNKMLASLEKSSMEAKKEGDQVAKIKAKCEEDAARIARCVGRAE